MPPGIGLGEYNENRAMVYDAKHDLVFLVLEEGEIPVGLPFTHALPA